MRCSPPVTYIEPPENSDLGRFLLLLFQTGKRELYCRELLTFARTAVFDLGSFARQEKSYSRTIVARQEGGFEGMVGRWDVGIAGPVHGHPDYAFYHLLQGRLGVEHFKLGPDGPELVTSTIMEPGDHFCIEGTVGRFDNAIHRITALQESLSVHMYSDDALLGECFHDYPHESLFLRKASQARLGSGQGVGSGQ